MYTFCKFSTRYSTDALGKVLCVCIQADPYEMTVTIVAVMDSGVTNRFSLREFEKM